MEYSCNICKRVYASHTSLCNHRKNIHNITKNSGRKIHACKKCNKCYDLYKSKWKHERTCNGIRPSDNKPILTQQVISRVVISPIPIHRSTEILVDTTNKYKKVSIPFAIKKLVWDTYIGEHIGKGKCYCCKQTDIIQMSFHCGHVIAERNGGETCVENLRPICQICNHSMRTCNMHEFIEMYKLHHNL